MTINERYVAFNGKLPIKSELKGEKDYEFTVKVARKGVKIKDNEDGTCDETYVMGLLEIING